MKAALSHQTSVIKDTICGVGFDNHLIGLRTVCEETEGQAMPAIFLDESFKDFNHCTLFITQVSYKTAYVFMS